VFALTSTFWQYRFRPKSEGAVGALPLLVHFSARKNTCAKKITFSDEQKILAASKKSCAKKITSCDEQKILAASKKSCAKKKNLAARKKVLAARKITFCHYHRKNFLGIRKHLRKCRLLVLFLSAIKHESVVHSAREAERAVAEPSTP